MNKKGLTLVELIVSFTITVVIVIFLVQIIVNLTKVYNNNGKKTEILNKQALISENINTAFIEKKVNSIEKCLDDSGSIIDNCYRFNYENEDRDTLKIINNKLLRFEKFSSELKYATFGNIELDVIYTPTLQQNVNDGIFILTIPIKSDIDYNFDIKIIYQFNTSLSNIDEYFTP